MSELLTWPEAARLLRIKDRRTLVRRLGEYGVPTIPAGRSFLVARSDLERALAAAARPASPVAPDVAPAGFALPRGARLWDGLSDRGAA